MTGINIFLKNETTLKLSNDTNCLITAPSFIHPTIGDSLSNLSNLLDPEVFDHNGSNVILKTLSYAKMSDIPSLGLESISTGITIEEPVVEKSIFYEYNNDPNNWDEANALAISKGGRMPTVQEMLDWLTINGRIIDAMMWAPVYNPNIASPYKDWVQVGLADGTNGTPNYGHFTGRLMSDNLPDSPDYLSDTIQQTNNYNDYYFWVIEIQPTPINIDYKYLAFTHNGYPTLAADSTNLKAHYKFDGDFEDSSGNNAHLTPLTGTPTLSTTQSKIGKTAYFTSDSLKTSGFTFDNKVFSIAFWAYSTGSGHLLSQTKSEATNQALHIRNYNNIISDRKYKFGFYGNDLTSPTYDDDNQWVHLVFKINSDKLQEIYRNGVQIASRTSTAFLDVDDSDIIIGDWATGGTKYGGYMDDLRFYDKALSQEEITQLNTIPTSTSYTLKVPTAGTECSALIIGNLTYNYEETLKLSGDYTIVVGETSSITNTSTSISYNSGTSEELPISNSITNTASTYNSNLPYVIIKYKLTLPSTIVEPVVEPLFNDTIERMYPPVRNFVADTTTVSTALYGIGVYNVSYSSKMDAEGILLPYTCFNESITDGGHWSYAGNFYDTSGVYVGTSNIDGSYNGEWLKINFPVAVKLTKYGIKQRTTNINRAPNDFKIYGSNDNTNWDALVSRASTAYTSYNFEEPVTNVQKYYTYYALVVNKVFDTGRMLNFDEWYIYGKEQILVEQITPVVIPNTDYKYLAFPYTVANAYPKLAADSTNLKAHYKFDDANNLGLNSATSAITIGNATINGTPTLDSSEYKVGSSSYFSGANDDDALIIDDNSNKLYTHLNQKSISISFWCKSVSGGQLDYGRIFYGSPSGSANNVNGFQCYHNTTNQLAFSISNNGEGNIDGTVTVTTTMPAFNTAWSHIVCVIIPTSANWTAKTHTIKIYINGLLNVSSTSFYYPKITENYDFQIGRWTTTDESREYDGYLDDFRIYDKALSQDEITTLYNIQDQTEYSVTFDEPSGTECDILIVGGGGGGARRMGGGGGAGALIYDTGIVLNGSYTINVGNGGAGSAVAGNIGGSVTIEAKRGKNGSSSEIIQNSSIYYKADGGSGGLGGNTDITDISGATSVSTQLPLSGGSGGGNGGKDHAYGGLLSTDNIVRGIAVGVANNTYQKNTAQEPSYTNPKCFGNEGGVGGGDSPWLGSGGGGAGGRGQDVYSSGTATSNNKRGVGGVGKEINITNTAVYYAGGGGGGNWDTSGGAYYNDGGQGGGGRSGTKTTIPIAGLNGTGGGGGGDGSDVFSGGNGGSGIVIIRYKTTKPSTTSTTTTSTTSTPYKPPAVLKYLTTTKWQPIINPTSTSDFSMTLDLTSSNFDTSTNTYTTYFDMEHSNIYNKNTDNYRVILNASVDDGDKYVLSTLYYNENPLFFEYCNITPTTDWSYSNLTIGDSKKLRISVITTNEITKINVKM
jgi:hypothetical protein